MATALSSAGSAQAASPKTLTNLDHPPVEITVRQTAELASYAKGHPETLVARYIDRAFDRLNVPYRIVYDLPPVGTDEDAAGGADLPSETVEGKTAVFSAWRTRLNHGDVRVVAKDANLLLLNTQGGGAAAVGGWAAVAAGGSLTRDYAPREWVTPDDPQSCVFGALHELAHTLGAGHDPNWGRAWNDPDTETWNRTPTARADSLNIAGETLPAREYETQRKHLAYHHEVARDGLQLKPVDFYTDAGLPTLVESLDDI